MTTNRISSSSLVALSGAAALSRALANPRVATLAKALDIDLANEEQLAPALAKAMSILDRTGVGAADGSGEGAAGETASPLIAAAALAAVPAKVASLSDSQVSAALRAYRLVAAL